MPTTDSASRLKMPRIREYENSRDGFRMISFYTKRRFKVVLRFDLKTVTISERGLNDWRVVRSWRLKA